VTYGEFVHTCRSLASTSHRGPEHTQAVPSTSVREYLLGVNGDAKDEITGRSMDSEEFSNFGSTFVALTVPHAYYVEASQPKPQEPPCAGMYEPVSLKRPAGVTAVDDGGKGEGGRQCVELTKGVPMSIHDVWLDVLSIRFGKLP